MNSEKGLFQFSDIPMNMGSLSICEVYVVHNHNFYIKLLTFH